VKLSKGENKMEQKINTTFRNHQERLETVEHSSIATDTVTLAKHIVQRAERLAESVNVKLYPVMAIDTPKYKEKEHIIAEGYPPLFSELQHQLFAIENALDFIEYSLERTTL
jgi:K+-sensing histidine kinase KdpD